MSPGVAHAVLYAVVGEIGAVRCGGKGKFQNPHPRQTGIRQQLRHVGRRLTQIFCDEADTVEPAGEDVQQIQSRPLDPAAGFGGRRTVGHRPIAGEAPEMINADHVIQSGGAVHPADPPAEAVPLHGVIIVERIAPKLAVLGEVVRRNTGHLCGNAPAVQTEHGSFRPDVSGVHGHINRQVADDTDAKAVDIGLQGGPLEEEQKLDIGEQFHILPQQLPVPGQSRRIVEPDSLIGPFLPGLHAEMPLEGHEQSVVRQPGGVFLCKARHRAAIPHPASFRRLFQQVQTVFIELAVVHMTGIFSPVPVTDLLLRQKPILDQQIQINEIEIARIGGKTLVGGITVAGGTEGEHLPVPLTGGVEQIGKVISREAHSADTVGGGQRKQGQQNTGGTFHRISLSRRRRRLYTQIFPYCKAFCKNCQREDRTP